MPDIASRDIFHLFRDIFVRSPCTPLFYLAAVLFLFPDAAKVFSHSVSSGSR